MAEEGYDVEAVSDTSHDMYCVICLKLMRNAIQMNCGHGMCDACFHKLVKYAKERYSYIYILQFFLIYV